MVYLGENWQGKGETKEAFRRRLQENAKFDVTDQCKYDKMFTANDISIQEIDKMDGKPGEKEWVLLMKLDWANEKGYLASQLQDSKDDNKCRKLDYLPHTEIGVSHTRVPRAQIVQAVRCWPNRARILSRFPNAG